VLQEGMRGGLPSTESLEDIKRCDRSPQRQHGVSETPSGAANCVFIFQARLLERVEGVSRKHLGPLVAKVSSAIASSKDVAKGAEETVLREGGHDLQMCGRILAWSSRLCLQITRWEGGMSAVVLTLMRFSGEQHCRHTLQQSH